MPTKQIKNAFVNIVDLLVDLDLCPSKSEARRLVEQGGISINKEKVMDPTFIIEESFKDGSLVLQKGKKVFVKVELN